MTTKQTVIKRELFQKVSIALISSGVFIAACFMLIVVMLKVVGLNVPFVVYIPGFLAIFMMSVGFLFLVRYRSLAGETGRYGLKEPTAKKDSLTHFLRTQIILGLALIAILHSLISIIIGMVIIILAAYFLVLWKPKS